MTCYGIAVEYAGTSAVAGQTARPRHPTRSCTPPTTAPWRTAGPASGGDRLRIRANSVAPGPIWNPADPVYHAVRASRELRPAGSPQPARPARRSRPRLRLPASGEASYVSGARIAVTGGKPILASLRAESAPCRLAHPASGCSARFAAIGLGDPERTPGQVTVEGTAGWGQAQPVRFKVIRPNGLRLRLCA
jgi:hypothetical protein